MTANIQRAATDEPEGAVTHWETDWGDLTIAFALQAGGMYGELRLSRTTDKTGEFHAAIIPVCHHSINAVPTPPPSVYIDGIRYQPAPPEEQ